MKDLVLNGEECQDHLRKCVKTLVANDGSVIYRDSVPRYWMVDEDSGTMRLLSWNEMQLNYPELLD